MNEQEFIDLLKTAPSRRRPPKPRSRRRQPVKVTRADGKVEVVRQGKITHPCEQGRRVEPGARQRWFAWYSEYLKTPHWRELRRARLKKDSHTCQSCGRTGVLQVHHLTYERVPGHELIEDLVTLCVPCHKGAHKT